MMSSNADSQANFRLEYDLIHRARMAWSDHMMRWRQIALPLSAAIVSFFILLNFKLWVVGWAIGLGVLVYWRLVEKDIDTQIAGFYVRIIELERELGMRFYSQYIFNNRNRQLPGAEDMQQYTQDGGFNYDGLLELAGDAEEQGLRFVGPRGHHLHRWAVIIYFIVGILAAVVYYPFFLN